MLSLISLTTISYSINLPSPDLKIKSFKLLIHRAPLHLNNRQGITTLQGTDFNLFHSPPLKGRKPDALEEKKREEGRAVDEDRITLQLLNWVNLSPGIRIKSLRERYR